MCLFAMEWQLFLLTMKKEGKLRAPVTETLLNSGAFYLLYEVNNENILLIIYEFS